MEKMTRRDFWDRLSVGAFWSATAAAMLGMFKLLKPAVSPDVSAVVKLGNPDEFPAGSMRHLSDKNVYIFGDAEGIYALSGICPHLGCIVSRSAGGHFVCPCHGSKFNAAGETFAGPAPSGLKWLEIRRAPNGLLYADTATPVLKGTKWRRA